MKKFFLVIIILFNVNVQAQQKYYAASSEDFIKLLNSIPPGSTLLLKSGTYKINNLVITKPIIIAGENYPVIEGDNQNEVLKIKSDGVTIKGVQIRYAGLSYIQENAAIKLDEVKNCVIEDNILNDNFFGIYLAKSSNCVIRNNKISASNLTETNSGNGIHLWYCRDITIENNEIHGHRDGIYFEFVRNSLVRNNYSNNNLRYGLHFMFSDSCTYEKNIFESNGAGVAVMYTKNVTMRQNKFINNWGAASFGVLLKDLSDCLIEKNLFHKNTNGLYLEGCNRITVLNNDFLENGWAIKLMANSMNNYFFDNNFITNSFDVLTNSRNNFNVFERNYWSKYNGYDLDKDGFGDIPFRPVNMFSILVEKQQLSIIFIRSLFIELLDVAERIIPSLTPINLQDIKPKMKRIKYDKTN